MVRGMQFIRFFFWWTNNNVQNFVHHNDHVQGYLFFKPDISFLCGKSQDGYFWSYATNYAVLNLLVTSRVWLVPASISFSFFLFLKTYIIFLLWALLLVSFVFICCHYYYVFTAVFVLLSLVFLQWKHSTQPSHVRIPQNRRYKFICWASLFWRRKWC